jgi:hypothetical protein
MAELQATIANLYAQKKSLDQRWSNDHNKEKKYTLNMVKIDKEVKSLITKIKDAEAQLARF